MTYRSTSTTSTHATASEFSAGAATIILSKLALFSAAESLERSSERFGAGMDIMVGSKLEKINGTKDKTPNE
jgi:hypothetical protein